MEDNCVEGERLDCRSEPISEPNFPGSFNIMPCRGNGPDAHEVFGHRHVYVRLGDIPPLPFDTSA